MKNVFHLTISVILGSLLGYSVYYKILKKGTTTEANTIAVDQLFFEDNIAFEKKQHEVITLRNNPRLDTLQVSAQLFETTQTKQPISSIPKSIQVKPVTIIETVEPLEVAQLQKNKTISIPVTQISTPAVVQAAAVQPAPVTQVVSASAETTETPIESQEQNDKKKFLFFSKKSRNN
jgi:hypothetical protein